MPFDRDNLHYSMEHLQDLLPQRVLKTTIMRKQAALRARGYDVSDEIIIPELGFKPAAAAAKDDKFAGVQTGFGLTLVYVPTKDMADKYYEFLSQQPCFGPSRVARCVIGIPGMESDEIAAVHKQTCILPAAQSTSMAAAQVPCRYA
jgi:hypothetical protein